MTAAMDDKLVVTVLDRFYEKVRADPLLAPVFEKIVGGHWPEHMERIRSFWRSALRISRGYHGPNFMPAHMQHMTIQASQLERWLALFEATLREQAPPETHARFMHVAHAMAENLRISLTRRDG